MQTDDAGSLFHILFFKPCLPAGRHEDSEEQRITMKLCVPPCHRASVVQIFSTIVLHNKNTCLPVGRENQLTFYTKPAQREGSRQRSMTKI